MGDVDRQEPPRANPHVDEVGHPAWREQTVAKIANGAADHEGQRSGTQAGRGGRADVELAKDEQSQKRREGPADPRIGTKGENHGAPDNVRRRGTDDTAYHLVRRVLPSKVGLRELLGGTLCDEEREQDGPEYAGLR